MHNVMNKLKIIALHLLWTVPYCYICYGLLYC
jgi:hypothetical protein